MAEQAAPTQPSVAPSTAPVSGGATTQAPTAPPGPPPGGGIESLLVTFVPLLLIFYFLIIRPESKRKKQKEQMLGALKPKDRVVTIGGLVASVVEIEGDDVVLLVDPKKDVRVRYRRSAIEGIMPEEEKK